MNYVDEIMFEDDQLSFDLDDLDFDDDRFDEMDLDALDLVGEHACYRCGGEFEAADELDHIKTHGVCQSCLSELMLEAAEDATGT